MLARQDQHIVLASTEWAKAVDAALTLQLEGLSAEALHLKDADAAGVAAARQQIIERRGHVDAVFIDERSEEHTSELQSLMRISYAVFCLNKNIQIIAKLTTAHTVLLP